MYITLLYTFTNTYIVNTTFHTDQINAYIILIIYLAMHLHYGDLTDSTCLVKIISAVRHTLYTKLHFAYFINTDHA